MYGRQSLFPPGAFCPRSARQWQRAPSLYLPPPACSDAPSPTESARGGGRDGQRGIALIDHNIILIMLYRAAVSRTCVWEKRVERSKQCLILRVFIKRTDSTLRNSGAQYDIAPVLAAQAHVRFDPIGFGSVGSVRFGLNWFGSVRFGSNRLALV